jgi:hypothetical protein
MKKGVLALLVLLVASGCSKGYYFYDNRYFKLERGPVDAAFYVLDRKGRWVNAEPRFDGATGYYVQTVAKDGDIVEGATVEAEARKRRIAAGLPAEPPPILEAGSGNGHY